MSTYKSKKKKGVGSKHTPEVFVLSPQLLHKLGINIANIQTPLPESSGEIVSVQDELFKKPRSTRKTNKTIEESSVMTTATLMKESVLLSPSFINPVEYQDSIENITVSSPDVNAPGTAQVLPIVDHVDEIPELSNISPEMELCKQNGNGLPGQLTVTAKADPINVPKQNDVSGNELNEKLSPKPQENYTSPNLDQSCIDLQHHIQTYIKENELFNPLNYLPCNKKKLTVPEEEDRSLITLNDLNIDDDHLDEAYSSDCSNGNNTISPVSAEFNLEPPSFRNIKGQKINILSEEVIDDSRLNEMISKSMSPSIKDKMIPVTVDTIVSLKRNVFEVDNLSGPIECKTNLNCQDQSLSANVSIEQVSTADETFLDNIITGVMKMDEIDINILEVSDSDLNTHNLSNSVYINMPEDNESIKLEYTSNITSGTDDKNHTKQNPDIPNNDLQCDINVQIANIQNISKEMLEKRPQDESNSDIFIEFIDKYPEVNNSTLNKINTTEYDSAMISQIEAYINTSHGTILCEHNPPIIDNINYKQHTDVNTLESTEIIDKNQVFTDNYIKDNNIIEKEKNQNKQEKLLEDNTQSGTVCKDSEVIDEVLVTPTEPVIEMSTNDICYCKCNQKNFKTTYQVTNESSNGNNEKVNEIASYLKMFVENKLKKASTIYSKSRMANISSQVVLTPKSCVHGVEKPGGSNEDKTCCEDDLQLTRNANQMPRTYNLNKNRKPIKSQEIISNPIFSHEKDINISDNIISETVMDNFCLCGDYGKFDFYDFEVKPYSHIHYWNNITTDTDIAEWFSEFNYIAYVENNVSEGNFLIEITEMKEKKLNPICWVGWNRLEKTIVDNLLVNNVKASVHMQKVLKKMDLPDDTIEATEIKNANSISLENADTNMIDDDNETVKNSISQMAADNADDPDNYFEVYQVIECSDEFEIVQADPSDAKIKKNSKTQLGADLDVLVNENKKSEKNNFCHYKNTGIVGIDKQINVLGEKQSKSFNEDSYKCKLVNTNESRDTKKSNKIAGDLESQIRDEVVLHEKTNLEIEAKELKTTRQTKRKPSKDINEEVKVKKCTNFSKSEEKSSNNVLLNTIPKDLIYTRDKAIISKHSKSKASIDVKTVLKIENEKTIDDSEDLIKSNSKRSNIIELELTENKEEVSLRSKRQASGDNKLEFRKSENITSTDDINDLKTDELSTGTRQSQNARKDVVPEVVAEKLSSFKKTDKIPKNDAVDDPKSNEATAKRPSRNVRNAIEPETDKIINNDAALALKTDALTTRRPSRNTKKHIEPKVNVEDLQILKKTAKIPNTDGQILKTKESMTAVHDLKIGDSTTKRHSRNARKDIDLKLDTEELNNYKKTDNIPNIDDVQHLKTNEMTTKRHSRNARKDIDLKLDTEELNNYKKTDNIPNIDDVQHLKTNEMTTKRQSCNAKKDFKLEMGDKELSNLKTTEEIPNTDFVKDIRNVIKKDIEADKITHTDDVQGPKISLRRPARNASKDIKLEIDAEEFNSAQEADQLINTSVLVVHDLKPNKPMTRRRSRNVTKDIKLGLDTQDLNILANEDNYISKDVTRRRSRRKSFEKIYPDLIEAKKKKTETTPHKKRSRRTKTSIDVEYSQKYLKVKEIAKAYENKKDTERKAKDNVILDLPQDRRTSSESKTRVADADVNSKTNISTNAMTEGNLEYFPQVPTLSNENSNKKATKRKISAIKSIDNTPKNIVSTSSEIGVASNNTTPQLDLSIAPSTSDVAVRITYPIECGVCDGEVEGTWIDHIAAKHFYLAWKKGDPVLDLNNPGAVEAHLKTILQDTKKLKCSRCGCKRKNPKIFLEHIKICDKSDDEDMALSKLQSENAKKRKVVGDTETCGMCGKMIGVSEWESHVMFTHYNLAWAVGDTPTNLKDANLICRLLKSYKSAGGQFACNLCGLTRSSALGFFAHVIACGKSAQEMEEHMEICHQCQKSYLAIHRQPHMAWHTQQQIKKENKLRALEPIVKIEEVEEEIETGGPKRKAARKAISMIQKLESNKDVSLSCRRCDFIGNTSEELKSHKCVDAGTFEDQGDESEDSLEFASDHSDDDGNDDDIECDGADDADAMSVSEEEKDNRRKKKHKSEHVSRYDRMPFEISSDAADAYVEKGSKLFFKHHFSDEELFVKWRHTEYTLLNEKEIETYTPQVAESCKFATGHKWTTLKRFESVKYPAITLFAGGCPASMCWVPGRLSTSNSERHYLALATYLGPDQPRYSSRKHYTSPGTLLQIWDFGHTPYVSSPKLSMCIAMDKGTVWSMSWCPSGARDSASTNDARLLGLVAVACSDGTAYIYSVPHPAFVNQGTDPVFIRFMPVAELRLYYNPEKEICQPSKIFWSMQKGHEVVAVGYSNGIVAFFDLCAESPLTRKCEGDRDIFYPYSSQQTHWSCITGLSMYPGMSGSAQGGAVMGAGVCASGSAQGGAVMGAGVCASGSAQGGAVMGAGVCASGSAQGGAVMGAGVCASGSAQGGAVMGAGVCASGSAQGGAVMGAGVCASGSAQGGAVMGAGVCASGSAQGGAVMGAGVCASGSAQGGAVMGAGVCASGSAQGGAVMGAGVCASGSAQGGAVMGAGVCASGSAQGGAVMGAGVCASGSAQGGAVMGAGVCASGSAQGGAVMGAGGARMRHVAAAAADTPALPLWPSALLINDDSYTSDMDFGGIVRKFSAAAAAAGCLRCSKLAQFSSPLLKTMKTHPAYKDMKKTPVLLIQMRRLKREPKQETEDLSKANNKSVRLEPSTYETAIEEYGVRIKFCKKTDRLSYDKEFNPGRFPLSEVSAMDFCPSPNYHQWLAVATHSGLIFFINTS